MPVTTLPAKPKPIEAPITLKSAASFVAKTGDDVIDAMADVAVEIASTSQRMADGYNAIMGNKLETSARNAVKAKQAAAKSFERVAPKIDRAMAYAETAMTHLRKNVEPKAPRDGAEMLYHGECRAALLRLPEAERGKAVEAAIADGDDVFAAAALLGSTRLTGLGAAQRAALLERFRRTRHAETMTRLENIAASFRQLDRLSAMFRDWSLSIGKEDNAKVEIAERSAQLAEKAFADA